jgi:DsbC/DsbD-like thiol-disulfide interchange protein
MKSQACAKENYMLSHKLFLRGFASFLGLLLLAFVEATAQSPLQSTLPSLWQSPWFSSLHSRSRLLVGDLQKDGTIPLGIEVELDPSYKTYWRSPGDSGFTPRFDTQSSQNIANIEIKWPSPKRFVDGTGTFNGYDTRLLLPVVITPQRQDQLVVFHVNFEYGVCHLQCIPTHAKHEMTLDLANIKPPSPHTSALQKAFINVPQLLIDKDQVSSLVEKITLVEKDTKRLLMVQLSPYERNTELFVEAPKGWVLGAPQRLASAPTVLGSRPHPVVFNVPVEFYPHAQKVGEMKMAFRLTLVSADGSYEMEQVLDISAQNP